MLALIQCWHYCQATLIVKKTYHNLEEANEKMQAFENAIQENIEGVKNLEREIEEMTKNAQAVMQFLYYAIYYMFH